jgi:hypothetical protein
MDHHSVHKSPPTILIVSQISPVHSLHTYFPYYIILPSTPIISNGLFEKINFLRNKIYPLEQKGKITPPPRN